MPIVRGVGCSTSESRREGNEQLTAEHVVGGVSIGCAPADELNVDERWILVRDVIDTRADREDLARLPGGLEVQVAVRGDPGIVEVVSAPRGSMRRNRSFNKNVRMLTVAGGQRPLALAGADDKVQPLYGRIDGDEGCRTVVVVA